MTEILAAGAMLAFQLYLRGKAVLHASAVDIAGVAIGFVGSSGMGKSTMAALMCAAGAKLITDDVLRIDFADDGAPLARLGATELRLRKGADTLAASFVGRSPLVRLSADDRHVLRLDDSAADCQPLAALVIPYPVRDVQSLTLQRLPRKEAVLALINLPRLLGWRDQSIVAGHFAQVSRIVERVPVVVARVPWGPPFAKSLASELRSGILAYTSG